MLCLSSYDVSTETAAGRRHLRKVAQVCQDFGQRVQKSVFECSVTEVQFEEVIRRLLDIIEKIEDNLRVYRLTAPKEKQVQVHGLDAALTLRSRLFCGAQVARTPAGSRRACHYYCSTSWMKWDRLSLLRLDKFVAGSRKPRLNFVFSDSGEVAPARNGG